MNRVLLASTIIFLIFTTGVIAQCASFATDACTTAAPTVVGNSINCDPPLNNAGRQNFRVTNMIANATYRVSNCGSGVDTQMTIRDLGGAVVGYNDDNGPACTGLAASIDFVPPTDGDYRIQINEYNCDTSPSFNETGDITVTLIADPPPPLANDDPCSAEPLTVGLTCNFTTFTNAGATDSGVADPGCAFYFGADVWFSVIVPPSGEVIIDSNTGDITDSGMAVYSGTCSVLSLIECDDDDSANGTMSYINLTGQTPGDTLYIRFWDYGNFDSGEFDICVSTSAPPGTNGAYISCPGDTSTSLTTDLVCNSSSVDFLGFGGTEDASYNSILNGGPTANRPIIFIDDADGCAFDPTVTANYTTVDFTVSTDETYIFTSDSDFDTMGYIIIDDGTWSAGNCPGSWTWITGDDDNGPPVLQAEMTANLQTGITYTLVTTAFSFSNIVVTNEPFTWTVSSPSVQVPEWYDAPTGGTLVGTGTFFDPVIDGPLTDTNTAGVYTFWADDCSGGTRERADFVIGKLWDGSTDNNWNIAANWTPSGIPTANDCVYIRSITESTIYDNISTSNALVGPPLPPAPGGLAKQFTINVGATFELATSYQLTVTDEIIVNGTFDIKDSANLVQVTDVITNVNTGNVSMQRTPETIINPYDYVYWSSPVDNFNVTDISYNSTEELIWKWIPSIGDNFGNWDNVAGGEIMSPGVGYIVRGLDTNGLTPANTTEFFGRLRNGIVQPQITRGTYGTSPGEMGYTNPLNSVWVTPEDDNWNLIGNPYPSAISYSDFITYTNASVGADNTIIDGTIYLWTHEQFPDNTVDPFYDDFGANYYDDYITNNFTGPNPPASFNGNISSGQAFFVLMLDSSTSQSENITFSNTMRDATYANDIFYRSSENNNTTDIERHRIWLNLVNNNSDAITLLVGYIEGATNANDRLYEGHNFGGNDFNFYSLIEEDRFTIQGRQLPFNEEDTIPLGIVVPDSDIYSVAINTVDGLFDSENQDIYIEDTYTNTIHDLRISPYTFASEAGTHNNRFILRYNSSSLGIDDHNSLEGIRVFEENERIVVKSDFEIIQTIEVFDILGRQLYSNLSVDNNLLKISAIKPEDLTLFLKIKLVDGKQKIAKIIF